MPYANNRVRGMALQRSDQRPQNVFNPCSLALKSFERGQMSISRLGGACEVDLNHLVQSAFRRVSSVQSVGDIYRCRSNYEKRNMCKKKIGIVRVEVNAAG